MTLPHRGRLSTPPIPTEVEEISLLTPPPTIHTKKRLIHPHDASGQAEYHDGNTNQIKYNGLEKYLESIKPWTDKFGLPSDRDRHVWHSLSSSNVKVIQAASQDLAASVKSPSAWGCRTQTASDTDENNCFRFLDLPLAIRKSVYTLLLHSPGLICVRQNHTATYTEKHAYLHADHRDLLPGICYALVQVYVNGGKSRFSSLAHTNVAILRACKLVYTETKPILYGRNTFDIVCPNKEMSPPPDFKVRLFPRGCQRLVRFLVIRVCSFYPLQWLLNHGGHFELKDAYRGLSTMVILFEVDDPGKGFARRCTREDGELWEAYVKRVKSLMANGFFGCVRTQKRVPEWMQIRVMFHEARYNRALGNNGSDGTARLSATRTEEMHVEPVRLTVPTRTQSHQQDLRLALVQAFDSLKQKKEKKDL